jgi:hypothetical protein
MRPIERLYRYKGHWEYRLFGLIEAEVDWWDNGDKSIELRYRRWYPEEHGYHFSRLFKASSFAQNRYWHAIEIKIRKGKPK